MAGFAEVLTRFHTAPAQPRLDAGRQASWRGVLPMALLGLLIAAFFVGDRVGLPDEFDPSAPFVVGSSRGLDNELRARGVALADQLSKTGYDGQWYLIQANDPLLRTDLPTRFDAPRYRALRMLYPTSGWLLAAGRSPATPHALLVVGMLAYALGCACCARIVSAYGRSPWWGVLFAVVPGTQIGLAFGTAEPLALALSVLGVSLVLDRRYLWAGLAFAGAALTKETYLAFAAVTVIFMAVDARVNRVGPGRWLRPAAAVALPGVASLFAWWVYVEQTLPEVPNPHGALGRFSPPFVGWWQVLGTIARGDYPAGDQYGMPGEAIMVASFAILAAAVVLALWLRQSLLAYHGFAWAMFGLVIAGFLLERYGSANRALAPAVLAAGLFLITARLPRRSAAPATVGQPGQGSTPGVPGREM
jgi:hypothetical protein